jgi:transcriptional regulator with XRE-family HTH domain
MRSKPSLGAQLGLTQDEMAMLLKIGRSAWSMYELGLRDIPAPAKLLLAEMLKHMQNHEKPAPERRADPGPALGRMLKENEFQQLLVARKIAALERRQDKAAKRAHVAEFFRVRAGSGKGRKNFPGVISGKPADQDSRVLLALEMRRASLDFERKWLESRLTGKS